MLQSHQLLLAGKFNHADQTQLELLVIELGLDNEPIRFTGYISDGTLIDLYNLCVLFVFPSWYEGFGLSVLEAMACGAPAVAANCSSLPEVLAHPQAMFDPFDIEDMSRKISEILGNEYLRQHLVEHGIQHAKAFRGS